MKTSKQKIEKGMVTLVVTVPQTEVKQAETKALTELGKNMTVKGFRKGKAPVDMVRQQVKTDELYSRMLTLLLSQELPKAAKKYDLKPIGNPRVIKSVTPDEADWEIVIEMPLLPEIKLGDYERLIKRTIKQKKEKQQSGKKTKAKKTDMSEEQRQELIFKTLLEQIKVEVPQSLIDHEVNRSLSRLLRQTDTLGVTVEQYLKSINKTADQLRQ